MATNNIMTGSYCLSK